MTMFDQCQRKLRSTRAEKFFKYSLQDPINYFDIKEPDYFCKDKSDRMCIFPQDIRSQSYWSKISKLIIKMKDV